MSNLRSANMTFFGQVGRRNRATAATAMNQDSSRSHSIFTIAIDSSEPDSAGVAGQV